MPGHSKRPHECFNKNYKARHSLLYSEYDTCHEFGIDPALYFAKSRIERALMVAMILAKRSLQALQDHDNRPKPKGKR